MSVRIQAPTPAEPNLKELAASDTYELWTPDFTVSRSETKELLSGASVFKAILKIQEALILTLEVVSQSVWENSLQITVVVQIRFDYSRRGGITSI